MVLFVCVSGPWQMCLCSWTACWYCDVLALKGNSNRRKFRYSHWEICAGKWDQEDPLGRSQGCQWGLYPRKTWSDGALGHPYRCVAQASVMFLLIPSMLWAKSQLAPRHVGSEIQFPCSAFAHPVYSSRCSGMLWFYLLILGQKKGDPSVLPSSARTSGGDAPFSLSDCMHMRCSDEERLTGRT